MKGTLKTITLFLLLVCLAFSTVACSSSNNNKPAAYGANLGNVTEDKWIATLSIPADINNFSLIATQQTEDSENPTKFMKQVRNYAICSTSYFGSGTTEGYSNGSRLKVTYIEAATNIQGKDYLYEKASAPNYGTKYDIEEGENYYFAMYLERVNALINGHIQNYSVFTYNSQKKAFVLSAQQGLNYSYEKQIKIFEKGFSYKEITIQGSRTETLEFVFYNANSTTVDVPQYVIDDINLWIANPDAFN